MLADGSMARRENSICLPTNNMNVGWKHMEGWVSLPICPLCHPTPFGTPFWQIGGTNKEVKCTSHGVIHFLCVTPFQGHLICHNGVGGQWNEHLNLWSGKWSSPLILCVFSPFPGFLVQPQHANIFQSTQPITIGGVALLQGYLFSFSSMHTKVS